MKKKKKEKKHTKGDPLIITIRINNDNGWLPIVVVINTIIVIIY